MNEVLSRLIKIFMDRITDDCMDGRRQLEENIPGCGDIFCLALQRALSVTSVPSFKTVIDLERLNMAVDSLTSQVVIACEKARLDFQLLTSGNNDDLFSKLKIDVAFLDILCQESVVTRATAESYHLLVHSVKSTLDLCFRQASQLISAIGIGYMSCPGATALGWRSLEGLLVNIYEASTFHGGLQDVYRRELVDLIEEMSVIIESLNNHVLNGEDGSAISFRSHDRLKSLYSKKCSVLQLSEVVNDNFVTRVPELRQVSYMISASILECDTAVAVAASQGTKITARSDILCYVHLNISNTIIQIT